MPKKAVITVAVTVIAAIAAAGAAVYFYQCTRSAEVDAQQALSALARTEKQCRSVRRSLEAEIMRLKGESERDAEQEQMPGAATASAQKNAPSPAELIRDPEVAAAKTEQLFSRIDSSSYFSDHGLKTDTHRLFAAIAESMKRTRPVVSEEVRDIYTLLRNVTYFYRLLGKNRLLALRDIVSGERDHIETDAALLYICAAPWHESYMNDSLTLPAEALYEYAAYFLHTIAGKMYLLRRDPGLRQLLTYYCILILDRTQREGINTYGIDIRTHTDALLKEMELCAHLEYRGEYLKQLKEIQEIYR